MGPEELLNALRNLPPEAQEEAFKMVRKLQWETFIEKHCGNNHGE